MNKRTVIVIAGLVGAIVAASAGWYFVSPLLINRTVDEQLPFELPSDSELEELAPEDFDDLAAEIQSTAAMMPDKAMEESMPADGETLVLLQGEFQDADNFHQGSGKATIFQLADGSRLLRLEDFSVTNGPELHVILATGASPTARFDLGNHIDLGKLKGNLGNQNYEISADVNIELYQSVVIYCVPFHVVFSVAPLSK